MERAAYILRHFWDGMVFSDTLRSRNKAFMEQNFANYLSLFPHADATVLPGVVDTLLMQSSADESAMQLLCGLAEEYLDGRDSPMRNEGYFILFLEAQLKNTHLKKAERSRLEFLLENAKKNRPGAVAADFPFVCRDGEKRQLHELKAERLLVYFNDPECEECLQTKEALMASPILNEQLASGKLVLLSVCIEGKTKAWNAARLPKNWLDAYDKAFNLTRSQLYGFKAMPTLYLLDRDKRVLLKDATVEEIEKSFE